MRASAIVHYIGKFCAVIFCNFPVRYAPLCYVIIFGWVVNMKPKYALPLTTSRHYISYSNEQETISLLNPR